MQPEDSNEEIEDIERFIVKEHHKKENTLLHFFRFEEKEAAVTEMMRLKRGCQLRRRPITTYVRSKEHREYSKTTRISQCRIGSN